MKFVKDFVTHFVGVLHQMPIHLKNSFNLLVLLYLSCFDGSLNLEVSLNLGKHSLCSYPILLTSSVNSSLSWVVTTLQKEGGVLENRIL